MKGWKKSLLIGFVIALTSEFYLSFFVSNFRISPSVVIFPILLMTIGIEVPVIPNAVVTSCLIFVSRLAVQLFSGVSAKTAVITVLPATFFYTTYGIMFRFMVRDRYGAKPLAPLQSGVGCLGKIFIYSFYRPTLPLQSPCRAGRPWPPRQLH